MRARTAPGSIGSSPPNLDHRPCALLTIPALYHTLPDPHRCQESPTYLPMFSTGLELSKGVTGHWFCVRLLDSRWGVGAADEVGQRMRISADALLQEPVEQQSAGL